MADDESISRARRDECLGIIGREATRLAAIAHDALDDSRGSLTIEKKNVDLAGFLKGDFFRAVLLRCPVVGWIDRE